MTFRPFLVLALVALAAPAFAQQQSTTSANASSAASSRTAPPPPQQPQDAAPAYRDDTAAAYARSGGSLLRAGRGASASVDPGGAGESSIDPRVAEMSLFVVPPPQRRVIRPHSLVTIIVREQSEFKSDGQSQLEKKASLEAELNQFISLNLSNLALKNAIGGVTPKFDLKGDSKFDGKGSASRTDSLSVRMQAEVVDVKPNGNLILQARRRLKTDDEDRLFQISGIARVEDITTDNTILSTQMYDLDLQQTTKGTVTEATKRGWLPRLLDAINPF